MAGRARGADEAAFLSELGSVFAFEYTMPQAQREFLPPACGSDGGSTLRRLRRRSNLHLGSIHCGAVVFVLRTVQFPSDTESLRNAPACTKGRRYHIDGVPVGAVYGVPRVPALVPVHL